MAVPRVVYGLGVDFSGGSMYSAPDLAGDPAGEQRTARSSEGPGVQMRVRWCFGKEWEMDAKRAHTTQTRAVNGWMCMETCRCHVKEFC